MTAQFHGVRRFYHLLLSVLAAVLLLLPSPVRAAEPAPIHMILNGDTRLNIGSAMNYLMDADRQMTLDQARNSAQWKPINRNGTPNFHFSNSTFWVHFSLENKSGQRDWKIEIANPQIDIIDFYLIHTQTDAQGQTTEIIEKFSDGDLIPTSQRGAYTRVPLLNVTLQPNTDYEIYASTHSNTTLLLPITFWQPDAYAHQELAIHSFLMLCFGALAGLLLYNAVLGYFAKDSSYFYYIHYVLSVILFQLALSGVGTELLWGDSLWLKQKMLALFIPYSLFAAAIFIIKFLGLRAERPLYYRSVASIAVVGFVLSVLAVILPERLTIPVSQGSIFIGCCLALLIGIILAKKNNLSARTFVVAWPPLLLATLITLFYYSGLLPRNFFTENTLLFGATVEMILLSSGLARRISQLRKDQYLAS
ncbi:MAG TPA: 7TM diverse intracellular signaling domain-containing protein, partial [Pseudomonadales bacterium]|nr:7TM diverse intracellular signaling domain-containing protein [Pseudomonadales bacterium]